jgi:hypothetical protein
MAQRIVCYFCLKYITSKHPHIPFNRYVLCRYASLRLMYAAICGHFWRSCWYFVAALGETNWALCLILLCEFQYVGANNYSHFWYAQFLLWGHRIQCVELSLTANGALNTDHDRIRYIRLSHMRYLQSSNLWNSQPNKFRCWTVCLGSVHQSVKLITSMQCQDIQCVQL